MSTLGDVCIKLNQEQYSSMMFGYTAERRKAMNESFKQVRKAIIEEFGADLEKLNKPARTKLGPKSQAAFDSFEKVCDNPGGCAFPVRIPTASELGG